MGKHFDWEDIGEDHLIGSITNNVFQAGGIYNWKAFRRGMIDLIGSFTKMFSKLAELIIEKTKHFCNFYRPHPARVLRPRILRLRERALDPIGERCKSNGELWNYLSSQRIFRPCTGAGILSSALSDI